MFAKRTPHPPLSRSPFPHWGRLRFFSRTMCSFRMTQEGYFVIQTDTFHILRKTPLPTLGMADRRLPPGGSCRVATEGERAISKLNYTPCSRRLLPPLMRAARARAVPLPLGGRLRFFTSFRMTRQWYFAHFFRVPKARFIGRSPASYPKGA